MKYITVDGVTQPLSEYLASIRVTTKRTEAIQSMTLLNRQDLQDEFRDESNSLIDEPEICIMCGDKTGGVSRYCRSCRLAVIRKFKRVLEDNFTTIERDFLDDEIEGIGLNIKEE